MDGHVFLAAVLNRHMARTGYSSGQLSRLTGIPKATLVNWFNGRVQKPRHLSDLLKVASALHLDVGEASQLLNVCGFPSIEKLLSSPSNEAYIDLLRPWTAAVSEPSASPPFQAIPDLPYFTGREAELEHLENILLSGQDGIICSLHGMAGVGKTALAAHVAYRLRSYFHEGVLWANLETSDTMSILSTFARANDYDVSEYRDIASRSRMVRDLLAEKRVLIVLDSAQTSWEVEPLLPPSGPSAVIVTTRRQDLAVSWGSCRIHLQPFDKQKREALSLFAMLLTEGYVQVEEERLLQLADILGHLPLAIAIAASRLAYEPNWSLDDFIKRIKAGQSLDELVADHRSVRLSFALSFDLLSSEQKHAFAALSVFGGRDFAPEAVAHILEISPEAARDRLRRFFSLSLVQAYSTGRYRLHPLLHTFAGEYLGDDKIIERMIDYFVQFIEENAGDHEALDFELTNISEALETAYQRGLYHTSLRGVNHFRCFLRSRGFYSRADALLARAEAIARDLHDIPSLVAALFDRGHIARVRGDYDKAKCYLLECLASVQMNDCEEDIGKVLTELGIVAKMQANYEEAETYFRDALTLFYDDGNYREVIWILMAFGVLEMTRHNYPQAEAYLKEGLELTCRIDHFERRGDLLMALGMLTSKQGGQNEAEGLLREALTTARSNGDLSLSSTAMMGLGLVYGRRGEIKKSITLFHDGLQLARQRGQSWTISRLLNEWANVMLELKQMPTAHQAFQESLELAQATEARGEIGEALFGLARIHAHHGNFTEVRRLSHECLAVMQSINHPKTATVEKWYTSFGSYPEEEVGR